MKVVITGGHLSPAAALIESAPKDWQVFFLGRRSAFEGENIDSLEYQTIKALDIPFFEIPNSRFQRKFTRYTIPSLAKIPYSLLKSINVLKKIKPDVVVGFGGYVALPVCLAARFLKIPVVIHEQTFEAGAANLTISKWAKKVCVSWESSAQFFPKEKVILTGNPLRAAIIAAKDHEKTDKKVIFVTGGSTGAHFINSLVANSLEALLKKYYIVHQIGGSKSFDDYKNLRALKRDLLDDLSDKYVMAKFIPLSEIGKIMQLATIVVGRSGVNTVSELLYLEKPAVLIPIPYSQKNEQLKNAQFLKNAGLAEILEQEGTTSETLTSTIDSIMDNINKYKVNPDTKKLLSVDAAGKITAVIEDVCSQKE